MLECYVVDYVTPNVEVRLVLASYSSSLLLDVLLMRRYVCVCGSVDPVLSIMSTKTSSVSYALSRLPCVQ